MSKENIIDIIWEYIVKEKYLDQFLRIYSPGGEWAKLFREYPGFIKTELKHRNCLFFWHFFSVYSLT